MPVAMDCPEEPKPAGPGPVPGKPELAVKPGPEMPGNLGVGSSRIVSPRSARNWSAVLSSLGLSLVLFGL